MKRSSVLILLLISIAILIFKNLLQQKNDLVNRATIGSISNAEGIIKKTHGNDEPAYVIYFAREYLQLYCPELPASFKQDELPVVFSGNLKAMNPLEDEFGQYFEIVKISKNPGIR